MAYMNSAHHELLFLGTVVHFRFCFRQTIRQKLELLCIFNIMLCFGTKLHEGANECKV